MTSLLDILDFLRRNAQVIGAVAGTLSAASVLAKVIPLSKSATGRWLDSRYLRRQLGSRIFTEEDIRGARRNYVHPDCQNIDPAGGEAWRRDAPVRQAAFSKLDQLFEGPEYRHTVLLADSGMGKTSLLLNFYARSRRARSKGIKFEVVPLGHPRADELIASIDDKLHTILLLDAFDEDTKATGDYRGRLKELLLLTADCRHVLITCRTQFFGSDDEIPRETGIMRFGPTKGTQTHDYTFHKLYLSPFSDSQVERYLNKRWSFWHKSLRNEAQQICRQLGDLTLRPMVLANVEALLQTTRRYTYSFEVYEQMIEFWVKRESARVDAVQLRLFSERLAREIYSRREELKGERLPMTDAMNVAKDCGVTLPDWQIRGRSLLNRDAEGRLKFAHRSVMEFLYICDVIQRPSDQPKWTDQMATFFVDMALHGNDLQQRAARSSALHVDSSIRERLVIAIQRGNPWSLEVLPISLGVFAVERFSSSPFLLLLTSSKGEMLAVSRIAMPSSYINARPETTEIGCLGLAFNPGPFIAHVAKPHVYSLLQFCYRVAFGQDIGPIWDGKISDIFKNAHLAYSLAPMRRGLGTGLSD